MGTNRKQPTCPTPIRTTTNLIHSSLLWQQMSRQTRRFNPQRSVRWFCVVTVVGGVGIPVLARMGLVLILQNEHFAIADCGCLYAADMHVSNASYICLFVPFETTFGCCCCCCVCVFRQLAWSSTPFVRSSKANLPPTAHSTSPTGSSANAHASSRHHELTSIKNTNSYLSTVHVYTCTM